MSFYSKENIKIKNSEEFDLHATFYQPMKSEYKATIIYFHGGGFIFGYREDLPEEYIKLFTENGIGVVAVDYPLAPEVKLSKILQSTHQIMDWFVEDFLPKMKETKYFILGRSAGGFLALSNGDYANKFSNQPLGIISLYGYFNLNDASFSVPNRHYLKYPKVNDRIVASLIQNEPVVIDKQQKRFPIYLAARQKGDWMDLVLTSSNKKRNLSLSHDKLQGLPPLFVAAATKDPDVPARQSRQLAKNNPDTDLHLLKLDEHDFDRIYEDSYGISLYREMISWLLMKLS